MERPAQCLTLSESSAGQLLWSVLTPGLPSTTWEGAAWGEGDRHWGRGLLEGGEEWQWWGWPCWLARVRALLGPPGLLKTDMPTLPSSVPRDKYQVFDSAPRGLLRVEELEDQGQTLANVFILRLLENSDDREATYMLKASSQ